MHILFLTDNFPPEFNAPASRTYEHAKEWVNIGYDVTVITCVPNFPYGKVFTGYKNKLWQTENIDGIRVIRVWSYIAANKGFFKRLIDFVSFALTSFFASFFIKNVDIVIGTSPQFFTAVSAYFVSVFKRCRFFFELRDLWPESIRVVGAMQSSRMLNLFEKLEIFLYQKADCIVSVTESFKCNLKNRGINPSKITVITNGVNTLNFKPMHRDQKLLNELGINGKFILGYIGTHGMAHNLQTLLEAAYILQESSGADDIHFLFVGDGAEKENLVNECTRKNLKNVSFLTPVERNEVQRYLSILDVAVVHLKKTDLFKTVIPSKIFECMGMGIPILHGVEGESAEIITKNKVGLLFEPENSLDLVKKSLILKNDNKLMRELSHNGAVTAKMYDRKLLAHKMASVFQS